MFWRELDQRICEHLSGAKDEVVLVAPFIKAPVFLRLLTALRPGVIVRTFTRWRVDEVAAGVSDLEVLDVSEARGRASVYLCDELHAKIFLVDNGSALIGSVNITAAALGLSSRPNFEIMHPIAVFPSTVRLFMADLEGRSRRATRLEAENIRARADALHSKLPLEALAPPDAQGEGGAEAASSWFPTFRSPDRLYGLALDVDWMKKATLEEPALRDLIALAPPLDSGEPTFDAHVRGVLLNSSVVAALEAFLTKPQRFGALTDWLRTILPDAVHEERQTAGQTLIRWLLYFAPDRFEVGVPGSYSEVLKLR
ncbi:phospholipase D family protein [Oharaeibacter diazotrophicus]|uniref:Phospholipase D n=1 Tax=Oharaeibacter diazotrophicus TaxID=1920512 RepID=A0A4R6RPV1_9HYPH|nr:phospholipase D family protein [Oharaeibacter diazotrophicus]TDP88720.1 phospholipase D-like protein [Oharaeibacter diazotrophicus]BBE74917.1 hypothetical protein OHA_3_00005 [Pleomorphomonas sp. SM30]GLS79219.1 hypothetical protein GCM10007904_45570 [Oharaeibacter diazotrophicus]